jgi:hypothetical protein
MPYKMAGIDVHKKRLVVVVADVEVEEKYQFERRGTAAILSSCACCRNGSSSSRSRKW